VSLRRGRDDPDDIAWEIHQERIAEDRDEQARLGEDDDREQDHHYPRDLAPEATG
jgi:hypothetical protein